jgi:hypothetical protein
MAIQAVAQNLKVSTRLFLAAAVAEMVAAI